MYTKYAILEMLNIKSYGYYLCISFSYGFMYIYLFEIIVIRVSLLRLLYFYLWLYVIRVSLLRLLSGDNNSIYEELFFLFSFVFIAYFNLIIYMAVGTFFFEWILDLLTTWLGFQMYSSKTLYWQYFCRIILWNFGCCIVNTLNTLSHKFFIFLLLYHFPHHFIKSGGLGS